MPPFTLGRALVALLVSSTLAVGISVPVHGQPATGRQDASAEQLDRVVDRGLDFLAKSGQSPDGTFSGRVGPGITALAVTAALRNGRTVDDPMVAKGLQALESFVKPDGGIYGSGRLKNYETCVAILCFSEANADGRYNALLKNAEQFVRVLQYGPGDDRTADDPWYGGVGYGGSERPDLSNTVYLIDALRALENPADAAAIQRALVFVSRCQNLQGPHNTTQFADKVNDGGFYYAIPLESSDADDSDRVTENGGLRSYGSMTYAGLKSMIYAGLTSDDPRVKAAVQWITNHYSVEQNPGQGDAGLYYYYHTFAAGLKAAGIERLTDKNGDTHDWRSDLIAELAERQNDDGSWSNENRRWLEDNKNLATSFALLALSYCRSDQP